MSRIHQALISLSTTFLLCGSTVSLFAQHQATPGNSNPRFLDGGYHVPAVRCISAGATYSDSVIVFDVDLMRRSEHPERLRAWVAEPATGFQVLPNVVSGPIEDGKATFAIRADALPNTPGKLRIKVVVADEHAYTNNSYHDTLDYYLTISLPTPFSMPLTVHTLNSINGNRSVQTLEFGTGARATTGFEPGQREHTDADYCEYELPPLPPTAMFDARWHIPATNGTLRDIYPVRADATTGPVRAWIGTFQRGSDGGIENSPVRIRWSRGDAQRYEHPLFLKDQAGVAFSVNMKTGAYAPVPGVAVEEIDADNIEVAISLTTINGFKIEEDQSSSVKSASADDPHPIIDIDCAPNPIRSTARISATLARPAQARVEIFDEGGHRVRSLAEREMGAGRQILEWDGADDTGRRCPNGAYGIRLTVGSRAVWTWAVLQK